jgi:hypothetical protein
MKYWNKSKKYREQQWVRVTSVKNYDTQGLKLWCQRQDSPARFYYDNVAWWFESKADASWFLLKWAE